MRHLLIQGVASMLILAAHIPSSAADPLVATDAEKQRISELLKEEEAKKATIREDEATRKFAGLNLGVGLTFTINVGELNRVEEAVVANGVVRVTKENNNPPRVMLESHYFFTPHSCLLFFIPIRSNSDRMCGVGPFVGIQNGSDEIIQAIGAGIMFGFRRAKDSKDSFNIGIGAVADTKTKVLGNGIVENEKLPDGDSLRYKEKTGWGILLLTSFGF